MSTLSRCRVVLVRPHYAGNLGSAARVMANFGLSDLVLVAPVANRESMDAVMMATHGLPVLTAARTVSSLAEAVADCGFVLSTSGEVGGLARKGFWGTPEEKLPQLLDTLPAAPAAVVFGPEPHGLTVDEITAGHGMMFIPSAAGHESLNLAQAVAVVLYELHKQWLKREHKEPPPEPPAAFDAQERMFAHLREALTAQRFLWDFRADGIFHVLRTVITRGQPTVKELKIFHGLAQQLAFIAKQYGVPHPTDVPKTNLGDVTE
ncbi:MAG: TrmH family RNA methyltransferase [Gemmataceae bacterium]